ncbi:hypothetical protein [Mucilaginibacter sp. PPCGB 2223]|uniref:hypothetical protein n=1 Tax=Mucilaginibacter sp. PPCGB 2223 TaxID=1886027 RepID=UPI0015862C31|nr:hypothetical protein [Mucilaginibacter sp. PPCGB 2223]
MKKVKHRKVKIDKENEAWNVQQQLGRFAVGLDRLPDAGAIQRNPQRSAPQGLTDMVF